MIWLLRVLCVPFLLETTMALGYAALPVIRMLCPALIRYAVSCPVCSVMSARSMDP